MPSKFKNYKTLFVLLFLGGLLFSLLLSPLSYLLGNCVTLKADTGTITACGSYSDMLRLFLMLPSLFVFMLLMILIPAWRTISIASLSHSLVGIILSLCIYFFLGWIADKVFRYSATRAKVCIGLFVLMILIVVYFTYITGHPVFLYRGPENVSISV